MSKADLIFKSMCLDIIENGCDTKGEKVRPVWPDTNEKAYTIKKFGVVNRYNLMEEFPAITFRKTAIKSAADELLWIWQKKSNNIKDLNSHIWDEWADNEGSIGKAYGYQIGKAYTHHMIPCDEETAHESFKAYHMIENKKEYPSYCLHIVKTADGKDMLEVNMDQIDSVIWDLKHNPYSRRIMTNIYNFSDLKEMNLYPCAYSVTFNVTKNNKYDKPILNAILNQRSQDVLAANNWNVCQYSILLMMIAQVCDMIPGELVHVISDCHIYDRHVPIVKDLISREMYPAPKVSLNPDIKNFYDFTTADIYVEDYNHGPQIKNIPIAV